MKNFTKLLMAVVLLATYSCVQDQTEDLSPVVSGAANGSGELKTLQVSLPTPTRTELGDKVDGKYPVFWSESDVLAVNGEPTTKISIDENDKSSAIFDLPLGSTIPYNIVYPYPGEDVAVNSGSGLYPVVFAANQHHTEGTFAQGAAPMHAWSDGFSDVQMHHLSTVLRFEVKAKAGETVDLKYVSVSTIEAEPIAGVFDVYCGSLDENDPKTASLEAREGASSTVFYNFDNDQFNLTEEGSVFYIAVPHGSYGGFEVNIVANNGNVCTRTFNASGEVALLPGKVREFPAIEFETTSKMLLIGTDADMLSFADMVKAGTFDAEYQGALLVADIDVTDKGLTTIDNYTSVFEGRHYSIKGLTQPLFGENVVAKISNVKVQGNLVEESNGKVGLIARSLAVGGRVFNCSVEGSIDYRNPNIVAAANLDLVNIGGAVGGVYGAEVSIVKSSVDVTISVAGPNGNTLYNPCIGGVVGYACASGEALPVVTECSSEGTIIWDDASTNTKVTPFIGGVAGYVAAGTFADNVNDGALEIRESMHDLDWGGVIGASAVSVERCVNSGSMTINEQVTTANIGGVVGQLEANADASVKNSIVDCENSGLVNLNENFKIVTSANIGGVVALVQKRSALVSGCYNSGAITYLGECLTFGQKNKSGNTAMCIGGVVGLCWADKVDQCGNRKSGEIVVRGKVSGNDPEEVDSPDQNTGIGGVIGARLGTQAELGTAEKVLTSNCNNEGNVTMIYEYLGYGIVCASACIGLFDSDLADKCVNSGSVLTETSVARASKEPLPNTGAVSIYTSGVFGYIGRTEESQCTLTNCENSGTVNFHSGSLRTVYASAINSICAGVLTMQNCTNTGDVIVDKDVDCLYVYAGGVIASSKNAQAVTFSYCSNKGHVTVNSKVETLVRVGGVFGQSDCAFGDADNGDDAVEKVVGVENSGVVSFSGSTKDVYIGGYTGDYSEHYHQLEFVNTANGSVIFDGRASGIVYIGGYAGKAVLKLGGDVTAVNRGKVVVKGFAPAICVSGGFGYASLEGDGDIAKMTNYGIVEMPAPGETTEFPTSICMGGLFGEANLAASYSTTENSTKPKRSIFECTNYGEIRYHGLVTDGAYIGGVVGKATSTPIYNCVNEGKVISTGNAGDLPNRVSESADKSRMAYQLFDHDLAIGGIVGETNHDVVGSTNKAAIDHTCVDNPLKYDAYGTTASSRFDIGGLVGRVYIPDTYTGSTYAVNLNNLTNEQGGTVTINGNPYCTTNTSSLDWGTTTTLQSNDIDDPDRTSLRPFYRMNVAGIVGRIHDHSLKDVKAFLTGTTNNAAVIIPNANYSRMVNIAGVLADVLFSHTTLSNTHNTGKITLDNVGHGTSLATSVRHAAFFNNLGGIVANLCDYRIRTAKTTNSLIKKTLTYNNCTNSGDLYYGEVAASIYQSAGGMLGQALHQLEGYTNWSYSERLPLSNMTITMNNCENSGNISYFTKMVSGLSSYDAKSYGGGMVGSCGNATTNYQQRFTAIDLLITRCKNFGNIQFERSNGNMSPNTSVDQSAVGGIVGFYVGGIGQAAPSSANIAKNDHTVNNAYHCHITSCENHGRVWGFAGHIGGILGRANWYTKITGTPEEPTVNYGDVVVARNESAGNAVRRTGYGTKVIYAGGIAGTLVEYYTDTRFIGDNTAGTNEGWPAYSLGTQYATVEYAINKGAVGSTSYAGGIVGYFRSLYCAGMEIAPSKTHQGGIYNCTNLGDIYALEGATSQVGSIVGSLRNVTITENTSYVNSETTAVAAKPWPIGVRNCVVGGIILRGANRYTTADAENYMNVIYGENWNSENASIIEGKDYDGCVAYTTPSEDAGEGDEEGVE